MDDRLAIAGVRRRHDGPQGTWIESLVSGVKFRALMAGHPPVAPDSELGYDPRMVCFMEVLSSRVPNELKAIDAKRGVRILDHGTQTEYSVTSRENNAADCVHVFTCHQLTANDQ